MIMLFSPQLFISIMLFLPARGILCTFFILSKVVNRLFIFLLFLAIFLWPHSQYAEVFKSSHISLAHFLVYLCQARFLFLFDLNFTVMTYVACLMAMENRMVLFLFVKKLYIDYFEK